MNHLIKVIIDFNFLKRHNLNPDEYVYLYARHYHLVNVINDLYTIQEQDLICQILENKGYLNCFGESVYELRNTAVALFEESDVDTKFIEFYGTYPLKVPNGTGGYRPLRAKEYTSKQGLELKKLYVAIIKKEIGLHDKIMKGLLNYLHVNKHKLTFIVAIDKFLRDGMWEMYEDIDREQDKFNIDV